MDFSQAFDRMDRRILWYKLFNSGVSNKLLSMIQSIYSIVKLRIRTNGITSCAFDNYTGVKQGEPLYPLLFIFFINDIAEDLRNDNILSQYEFVDTNV